MTSGRKRKERRAKQFKQQAPAVMNSQPESTEKLGGFGGTHGVETLVRNQRIEARALTDEWDIDFKYRKPLIDGQIAIAIDPKQNTRDRSRAFTAVLAANKQNMEARGVGQPSQQINVGVNVGVAIVEQDDWYGNNKPKVTASTNGHVAASNGSSAGHRALNGSVQGGGVRPEVGQNGDWFDDGSEGPREPQGPEEGSD